MLSVDQALEIILARIEVLPGSNNVGLLMSLGRILAEDIIADIPIPPFDNSAVDGYAVRAEETRGAGQDSPVSLRTAPDIPAGSDLPEPLLPGAAARIMTGAPVPPGADAVVMIEDITREVPGTVEIHAEARSKDYIRTAGEDVKPGDLVLASGTRIRAAEVGMLATMGRTHVLTAPRPRVGILSTGDEVVDVEEGIPPPPGKIRNSNQWALAALVREAGAVVEFRRHVRDDLAATEEVLSEWAFADPPVDVIVSAGGVSVGDRDYVKPALEKLGSLDLWKVAMKPGKPLAFGRIGKTLFFGLPGNPVSAMVTFELFVRPALAKLAGFRHGEQSRPLVHAELKEDVRHSPGRREFVRAWTETTEGRYFTKPTGAQGSGLLHSMTRANSLMILSEESGDKHRGDRVEVMLLA